MRNFFYCLMMVIASAGAQASTTASITCGTAARSVRNNGQPAVLNLSYQTGADTGTPGLFWIGIISPDEKLGSVLTSNGWADYQGGLYPFQSRYDRGLPGKISMAIPFPNNAQSTAGYVGYKIYVGHGAYDEKARQGVAARRAALNSAKANLVAVGKWHAELESDERHIWALIQRDMEKNEKYGAVLTVPSVDCTLPSH